MRMTPFVQRKTLFTNGDPRILSVWSLQKDMTIYVLWYHDLEPLPLLLHSGTYLGRFIDNRGDINVSIAHHGDQSPTSWLPVLVGLDCTADSTMLCVNSLAGSGASGAIRMIDHRPKEEQEAHPLEPFLATTF